MVANIQSHIRILWKNVYNSYIDMKKPFVMNLHFLSNFKSHKIE